MDPGRPHPIRALASPSSGRLQAFFDANPEYWLRVFGRPPGSGDAREIIAEYRSIMPRDDPRGA